jgi:hypothetical protein
MDEKDQRLTPFVIYRLSFVIGKDPIRQRQMTNDK